MDLSQLIDIPFGTRLPGPLKFIRQHHAADPSAPLELDFPGTVIRCGGALIHKLRPLACLLVGQDGLYSSAFVTPAVADEAGLDLALVELTGATGTDQPLAFAVKVAANAGAGELIARAEEAGGGCGCGGGGSIVAAGRLSVGLAADPKDEMRWTRPVAARLKLWIDDKGHYGPWRPELPVMLGLFDCDTDWDLYPRRTRCYDDGCAAGGVGLVCRCGTTPGGAPRINCPGWEWFCSCS